MRPAVTAAFAAVSFLVSFGLSFAWLERARRLGASNARYVHVLMWSGLALLVMAALFARELWIQMCAG